MPDVRLTPVSGPARRAAGSLAIPLALLLVAGGFLLALLGAHVDPPGYTAAPTPDTTTSSAPAPTGAPPPADASSAPRDDRAAQEVGGLALGLYAAFLAGLLIVLAVLIARSLRVRRRVSRERDGRDETHIRDPEPGVIAERLAAGAAAGLDALDEEVPVADAIIACWQRLREAAARAGMAAVASDTPEEAILRVLRAGRVSDAAAAPLATLAGLYREARFSQHPMTRGDVWVARDALQSIVAELLPEVPDAH